MIPLLFAAAFLAQGIAPARAQSQDRPPDDIRITRAVFGSLQKSADVTAVVTRLAQPGLDEFYVAPKWLETDPAPGQTKSLVIFYEYLGKPHILTTTELGAVSQLILMEHADSALRRRPMANATTGVFVVRARANRACHDGACGDEECDHAGAGERWIPVSGAGRCEP